MPTRYPVTEPGTPFALVAEDLAPLRAAYPDGELFVPDGLEGLIDEPLSNSVASLVPWEYVATVTISLRGEPAAERRIVIRGVTVIQGKGDDAVFRRYVDWATVWAQLGVSSGRGEAVEVQHILGPDGVEQHAGRGTDDEQKEKRQR